MAPRTVTGPWPSDWPVLKNVDSLFNCDSDGDVLLKMGRGNCSFHFQYQTLYPNRTDTRDSDTGFDAFLSDNDPDSWPRQFVGPWARHPIERGLSSQAPRTPLDLSSPTGTLIYVRANSKSLARVSRVFRRMLTSEHFKEGIELKSKDHVVIPLPEGDPVALIPLVYIAEGKTARIRLHIDLQSLKRIAIVVDHYDMVDLVSFFANTWMDNLEFPPSEWDEDHLDTSVCWLEIAWVFRHQEYFRLAADSVIARCDFDLAGRLEKMYSPLPDSLIEVLQKHRHEKIEQTLNVSYKRVDKYAHPISTCSDSSAESEEFCDAGLLGSLIKKASIMGIWPKPEAPFAGIELYNLWYRMKNIRLLDGCGHDNAPAHQRHKRSHGVARQIVDDVEALENESSNLDLREHISLLPGHQVCLDAVKDSEWIGKV